MTTPSLNAIHPPPSPNPPTAHALTALKTAARPVCEVSVGLASAVVVFLSRGRPVGCDKGLNSRGRQQTRGFRRKTENYAPPIRGIRHIIRNVSDKMGWNKKKRRRRSRKTTKDLLADADREKTPSMSCIDTRKDFMNVFISYLLSSNHDLQCLTLCHKGF